jgi:hypothetical protein
VLLGHLERLGILDCPELLGIPDVLEHLVLLVRQCRPYRQF